MGVCVFCGYGKIRNDDNFCIMCGKPVSGNWCEDCDIGLSEIARFCPVCGGESRYLKSGVISIDLKQSEEP